MGCFLLLVDAPAVVTLRDFDVLTAGGVESSCRISRVVFVRELFDKSLDLLLVKIDIAVIVFLESREDAVIVERFALVSKLVRNGDAGVIFLCLLHRRQLDGGFLAEKSARLAARQGEAAAAEQEQHADDAEYDEILLSLHKKSFL